MARTCWRYRRPLHRFADYRKFANAILADQSDADHGEAATRAAADVATTAGSSRAHGHANALRASQRHNQAMSHTSAIVEPSQLSPAVTL